MRPMRYDITTPDGAYAIDGNAWSGPAGTVTARMLDSIALGEYSDFRLIPPQLPNVLPPASLADAIGTVQLLAAIVGVYNHTAPPPELPTGLIV